MTFKCIQHLSINGSDFQKTNVSYWYLPLQSWFYSFKKILHHISNFYIALCKATGIWEPRLLSNLYTFMTPFQTKWSLHWEGTWETFKCKIRIFLLVGTLSIGIPSFIIRNWRTSAKEKEKKKGESRAKDRSGWAMWYNVCLNPYIITECIFLCYVKIEGKFL